MQILIVWQRRKMRRKDTSRLGVGLDEWSVAALYTLTFATENLHTSQVKTNDYYWGE
jgi:hypothetical protein